jgi:hypothetical protein
MKVVRSFYPSDCDFVCVLDKGKINLIMCKEVQVNDFESTKLLGNIEIEAGDSVLFMHECKEGIAKNAVCLFNIINPGEIVRIEAFIMPVFSSFVLLKVGDRIGEINSFDLKQIDITEEEFEEVKEDKKKKGKNQNQ